jgi:hypothetical protein
VPEAEGDLFTEAPSDYPTSYLPQPSQPVHIVKVTIQNFKKGAEAHLYPFGVVEWLLL